MNWKASYTCGICGFTTTDVDEIESHDSVKHPAPIRIFAAGYTKQHKPPQVIYADLEDGTTVEYSFHGVLNYVQAADILNRDGVQTCSKR